MGSKRTLEIRLRLVKGQRKILKVKLQSLETQCYM